jgi:hypothetical protein
MDLNLKKEQTSHIDYMSQKQIVPYWLSAKYTVILTKVSILGFIDIFSIFYYSGLYEF